MRLVESTGENTCFIWQVKSDDEARTDQGPQQREGYVPQSIFPITAILSSSYLPLGAAFLCPGVVRRFWNIQKRFVQSTFPFSWISFHIFIPMWCSVAWEKQVLIYKTELGKVIRKYCTKLSWYSHSGGICVCIEL